jgi:hypothetical protein
VDGGPPLLDAEVVEDTHVHPTDASLPVHAKVGEDFTIVLELL